MHETKLDVRALTTSVLDRLYGEKHVNYCVFDGKHCKNTVETMFWKDFLYLCLSWPAALEHGKIEKTP